MLQVNGYSYENAAQKLLFDDANETERQHPRGRYLAKGGGRRRFETRSL